MLIGIPKEIMYHENRVAALPETAANMAHPRIIIRFRDSDIIVLLLILFCPRRIEAQ